MSIQAGERQAVQGGYERLFLEAMRLLDEHGLLLEFRRRMQALDEKSKEKAAAAG